MSRVILKYWRKIINKDLIEKKLWLRRECATMLSKDSVSEWLSEAVKKTFVWSVFKKLISYFRQIRIVRIIIAVIGYTVTLLGTGVAFVIFATVALFILPIVALFTIAIIFISVLQRKKVCRQMEENLHGKNVLVFLCDKKTDIANSFGKAIVLDHARKENCVVLIISPYLISPKGLESKESYISFRQEYENVYTVRKYVYFDLKRKILTKKCESTMFFV